MPRALTASLYLLVLVLALGASIFVAAQIGGSGFVEIYVFQNGKNASTLIQTPSGAALLVNTGADASTLRSLGETLPFWKRTILAVMLTSSEASTMGGLPEIMDRYTVTTLLRFGTRGSASQEAALATAEESSHAVIRSVPYGTRVTFNAVSIDIISANAMAISYGKTRLKVGSSTPTSIYISNGALIRALK
jgi:hypothetical protein